MNPRSTIWIALALCLAACDDGSDGEAVSPALPSAATPEAILAFIDSRRFEGPGWRVETPAPREESTPVSPHDRVQVFQNEALVQTRASNDYAPDSMAVKALYDAEGGTEPEGFAAMWLEPGASAFTYFCYGPRGRCGLAEQAPTPEEPVFGRGSEVVCGQCHGGMIFTQIEP